jgi:hypothetical protein
MRLRERGIYCLPNGRELIVVSNSQDGGIKMRDSSPSVRSEYELNNGGRLLTDGKPTAWDINNLTDTGRTASELSHMFEAESQHSTEDQDGKRMGLNTHDEVCDSYLSVASGS